MSKNRGTEKPLETMAPGGFRFSKCFRLSERASLPIVTHTHIYTYYVLTHQFYSDLIPMK